jgi:hypothetical protein
MYARAMAARWPVRVWSLPGEVPQYDVQMLWHATATHEPAHAWLRALVRRLFARVDAPVEGAGARKRPTSASRATAKRPRTGRR